ncbi:hypothetical protein Glove_645g52 [Diversispora epigaea]|uniref:Uncharacterized protein n=1 Tax=Diversispora epigaea TaxID=1348612 RepID=A0A397G4C4_9GLOM|nr:hypothetical protein Glove_645g52 [Diversispora epigaea]
MSSELALLRQENAKLMGENTMLMVKIVELEQIVKEKNKLEVRIVELEQTTKLSQTENSELKDRITKLEQKQPRVITNEISVTSLPQDIIDDNTPEINSDDTPKQIDDTSNSDICQESETQCSTSPIHTEWAEPRVEDSSTLLEGKEIIEFLESQDKERVSNLMRERNREKKLLRNNGKSPDSLSYETSHNQDLSSDNNSSEQSNSSCVIKTVTVETEVSEETKKVNQKQDSIVARNNELTSSEIKISYNQKVEQGLICKLLEFIAEGSHKLARSNDTMILQNLYLISGKQISGTLFHNNDMTSGDNLIPDSSPYLAHLFSKAEKTGRKEKLQWYCYSEKCEKKVSTLNSENNISNQMARTQIYDKMMKYLPEIKREYLRKKTQKAKTIYTLFKGIGKDKIRLVSYSADAISRLTDTQVQNIIKLYTDELDKTKSQKLIGVNNCSRVYDLTEIVESQISNSKTKILSETKVSMPVKPQASDASSILKTKASMPFMSPPETKTLQNNPVYTHAYFRRKVLDQYPDIFYEFNDENIDYYGITDEASCPLCKLDHDDEEGIKGEYKDETYYIKCEQHEIQITA